MNILDRFQKLYKRGTGKYRKFRNKHPWWHKIFAIALWFGYACLLLYGIFYISVYYGLFEPIPDKEKLTYIQNHTASEIYSVDGELLGRYFFENRTTTTLDQIDSVVIDALIATEDKRFYEHEGVDKKSLLRVFFKSIIGGQESSGGGSTISQQLVKNLYPRRDYGILSLPVAKTKEAIVARRLEDIYAKNDILELYLNTVSFGEDVYGIETATNRFFNVPPDSIKVEQAAVLIGMLKATTTYNPRLYPERSWQRRNVVLNQMQKYGYLTPGEADSLQELPLQLDYNYRHYSEDPAPYLREYLKEDLKEWCSNNRKPDGTNYNLFTDGLKITTSIHSKMQEYAEEAVEEHMEDLQRTFDQHWSYRSLWSAEPGILRDAKQNSRRYRALKEAGHSEETIDSIFKTEIPMNIFEWDGEISKRMSPLDSIKHYMSMLNAGFVVMEPKNGQVRAWVGGINHKYFPYDQILAKRQVGSTFKPIVYSAAIQQGKKPCDYIDNTQKTYEQYDDWKPRNADGKYGGMYSVQGALVNSVNVVSVKIIMEVGIGRVINLAQKMGIGNDLPHVPSIALGAADIALNDMVEAYTTFPNRGYSVKPQFLVSIADNNGNTLESFTTEPQKTQAIYSQTADIINYILRKVVQEGTGSRLIYRYGLRNEIAGKTGTTQSHADGWFIGYTPELVAGARVGAADKRAHFRTLKLGQGANMALPIVGKFYAKVFRDKSLPYKISASFNAIRDTLTLNDLNCPHFKHKPVERSTFEQMLFDLRNIFGPEREEAIEEWREQHEEQDDDDGGGFFDFGRKKNKDKEAEEDEEDDDRGGWFRQRRDRDRDNEQTEESTPPDEDQTEKKEKKDGDTKNKQPQNQQPPEENKPSGNTEGNEQEGQPESPEQPAKNEEDQ